MAGKKISQLSTILSDQIVDDDLITLVDSSETVITEINKKVTIEQFNTFLRDQSSVFPISFQPTFIETTAYGLEINGVSNQSREISNTVSNKTVNIADISIEDITKELEPLLIHELSYSDCSPDKIKTMHEASMNIGDTLATPHYHQQQVFLPYQLLTSQDPYWLFQSFLVE